MTIPPDFAIASVARSHVGGVRKLNEDACIERPEIGLWAVADGMGGHQAGDFASRTVVEGLAAVSAPRDAGSFIAEVRTRIKDSNLRLVEEAQRRGPETV